MSSIQYDYSTLSTSISRSELSSIVGHHIVEGSYDNEEGLSEVSSSSSEIYVHPSPPDRYRLVYLTFGLLGVATLMPWNFFITANDYWMYKYRSTVNKSCTNFNKTDLQASFTSYVALSNNVPYVLFLIICTLYDNRFSKLFRVVAPLFALFILFTIVTAFVQVNTDDWQMGFFALTILLIIGLGTTSAVLQCGVSGIAALLPPRYMHVMVLGQALAGIIASIAQCLSLLTHCDSVKSALMYFFSADSLILITLIFFIVAHKSEFFQYHTHVLKEPRMLKDIANPEWNGMISLRNILKMIWPYALAVLIDMWVTIGIFPGVAVLAVPQNTYHGDLWNGKLFLPLTCFLLFNVSDFCGRAVGGWLPMPHSKRMQLLTLCASRFLFFPLFLLCNLQPRYYLPVMLPDEAYYVSFMTLLGFTNGYLLAVAMVTGIKCVDPVFQELAGVVLSTFLGMGLMLGALSSFICIQIL